MSYFACFHVVQIKNIRPLYDKLLEGKVPKGIESGSVSHEVSQENSTSQENSMSQPNSPKAPPQNSGSDMPPQSSQDSDQNFSNSDQVILRPT